MIKNRTLLSFLILSTFSLSYAAQSAATKERIPAPLPSPKQGEPRVSGRTGNCARLLLGGALCTMLYLAGNSLTQHSPSHVSCSLISVNNCSPSCPTSFITACPVPDIAHFVSNLCPNKDSRIESHQEYTCDQCPPKPRAECDNPQANNLRSRLRNKIKILENQRKKGN